MLQGDVFRRLARSGEMGPHSLLMERCVEGLPPTDCFTSCCSTARSQDHCRYADRSAAQRDNRAVVVGPWPWGRAHFAVRICSFRRESSGMGQAGGRQRSECESRGRLHGVVEQVGPEGWVVRRGQNYQGQNAAPARQIAGAGLRWWAVGLGPAEIKFEGQQVVEGSGSRGARSPHADGVLDIREFSTMHVLVETTCHRHDSSLVVAWARGQACNGRTWPSFCGITYSAADRDGWS